jgi:hypothetical protein
MERFWEKVSVTPSCWNWMACKVYGYGRIKISGKQLLAHRVSYEALKGKIPEGLQLDHLCKNRACVNPDHLEIVTQLENWERGLSPPRLNRDKTSCKRGHPLDVINTYVSKDGTRYCRACNLENVKRYQEKIAA